MNRTDAFPTLPAPRPGLIASLESTGARVASRATDRLAAAHDASHYLLTPEAVVTPSSIAEVAALLAAASAGRFPLTFRSGGTSLSGQASSSGVVVDTRHHFRSIQVLDAGKRVRTGPGATVRAVNARLVRDGRKLGPDPASEVACTIGGVVANNSSGMACGITDNTYRTLDSMVIVLPNGAVIDTSAADADGELERLAPKVHAGLADLRDRLRADTTEVARLRRLHAIKNTMGYGLNSFLDFDTPIDILQHLLIGSEGTLGFVAEATFRTVPLATHLATGLLFFETLAEAASAMPVLVAAGFATIELLDATSLRVAQRDPEATDQLVELNVVDHAALLVEFQETSAQQLAARLREAEALLASLPLSGPATLTSVASIRAALWHIRKGLFTAVAGNRPSGTTALLEDVAVPVGNLARVCTGLIELFERHGYEESVIFGHAKDGNIHFMLNERFDRPESILRYEAFTEEMVELVLGLDGTLKAEHGTGRVMAPYVRRQYGDDLYELMREIKALLDPAGVLNPGVLLDDDPRAHIRGLKTSPGVEEEVDRCVECGYCEPVCPSKDITLTPRERIVLRREIARAEAADDQELVRQLRAEYDYDGVQTCAVDGMCQTACPVLINTGDLVRRLRVENANAPAQAMWKAAAQKWSAVSRIGGLALTVADAFPTALPAAATSLGRTLLGSDTVPAYTADLPAGGSRRVSVSAPDPVAVYFSSCTTTMFGPADGGGGVAESFVSLCERAGIAIATPPELPSLCCGTPWKSKGLTDGYAVMKQRVADSLRAATRGGQLPVVSDAASCTEGLHLLLEAAGEAGITVIDAVEFVDREVLLLLPVGEKVASLTLHPTCSSHRLGVDPALKRIAAAAATEVTIPDDWGCCAFAGDRGMLHPELTASATAGEAAGAAAAQSAAHASVNRTCELGMTRATGQPYRHILEVLDEVTGA